MRLLALLILSPAVLLQAPAAAAPYPMHAPYAAWQPAPRHYALAPTYAPSGFRAPVMRPVVPWAHRANTPRAAAQPRPAEAPPAVPTADRVPAEAAKPPADTASDRPPSRQRAFLDRLRPLVATENARLLALRATVQALSDTLDNGGSLTAAQRQRLADLARRYRVDGDVTSDGQARTELLDKIDAIPVSLALAQAANESAWGTSRFAREANNLFGIWTYDSERGIVPRKRAAGKKHLIRKFDDQAASVRYYLFTLNSHPAYAELRNLRARARSEGRPADSLALASGLTAYSAKGDEYVRLIRQLIERFDLAAYDGGADRA